MPFAVTTEAPRAPFWGNTSVPSRARKGCSQAHIPARRTHAIPRRIGSSVALEAAARASWPAWLGYASRGRAGRTKMVPRHPIPVAILALAACGRNHPPPDERTAPSASVVAIGVTLGGCEDLDVCRKECDAGSADRCRRL